MNEIYGNGAKILKGICLKNLYKIRQRGYISAPDKRGKIKTYDKVNVDASICELERNKEKKRAYMRRGNTRRK